MFIKLISPVAPRVDEPTSFPSLPSLQIHRSFQRSPGCPEGKNGSSQESTLGHFSHPASSVPPAWEADRAPGRPAAAHARRQSVAEWREDLIFRIESSKEK